MAHIKKLLSANSPWLVDYYDPRGHRVRRRFKKKADAEAYLAKVVTSALRRAGLYDVRFHDLRHTFASNLVRHGVPLRVVQELLGHSSIAMIMRYAHLSPGDFERISFSFKWHWKIAAVGQGQNIVWWLRG